MWRVRSPGSRRLKARVAGVIIWPTASQPWARMRQAGWISPVGGDIRLPSQVVEYDRRQGFGERAPGCRPYRG